jgi:hypothetical protein
MASLINTTYSMGTASASTKCPEDIFVLTHIGSHHLSIGFTTVNCNTSSNTRLMAPIADLRIETHYSRPFRITRRADYDLLPGPIRQQPYTLRGTSNDGHAVVVGHHVVYGNGGIHVSRAGRDELTNPMLAKRDSGYTVGTIRTSGSDERIDKVNGSGY